jgi:protein-disulfide isomerase
MEPKQNSLSVPMAIVFAGLIIAGAVFFSRVDFSSNKQNNKNDEKTNANVSIKLDPVTKEDHLLGNPDSPIVLVEYSDLECPACKYFHPILSQVISEYGKKGQVAWVYRSFPLTQIHPKAPKEAEAAECVAELGGNQKFWDYISEVFTVTPANNGLDPAELPKIAGKIGIDTKKFSDCLSSGKYTATVSASYQTGIKAGVNGTPTTFLVLSKPLSKDSIENFNQKTDNIRGQGGERIVNVSSDGKIISISAAFAYQTMKMIIDSLLTELK